MNKKIISIFLISIFLLSTTSAVFASDDDDRNYFIGPADLFIKVQDDGLLQINESYNYTFEGQFNGVYRNIPLKDGESIENLKVSADGAYTKVTTKIEGGEYKIKVYLYSDAAHTKPIKDADVTIHYNYEFSGVVKIYDDVGELQFKLWGEDWDKPVHNLNAKIQFPNDEKIEYWINPFDNEAQASQNGNVITVKDGVVYSDSYLEFRGIIPLSEFDNPVYGKKIDSDGYDKIVKIQDDYANEEKFRHAMEDTILWILAISLIIPILIYVRYGREPKVSYDAPYEHSLPTDDSPIFVDAMFGTKTNVGKVSDNGIQASIMEMIDDNIIKIVDKDEGSKNLKLLLPVELGDIPFYKRRIVNDLLRPYARDNVLDFNQMKKDLRIESQAKAFNSNMKSIQDDYYKVEILPVLSKYFDGKGSKLFKIYCVGLAVISIIIMACSLIWLSDSLILPLGAMFFFVLGGLMLAVPNRIPGRWTDEGMTDYKKWKAFKKFIKDFSLIKEHPPESVAMWDKYLVYATALGSAKEVSRAMNSIAPAAVYDHSDICYYSRVGGPAMLTSAINTSYSTGSGGPGGAGGGSGGGGGGAF